MSEEFGRGGAGPQGGNGASGPSGPPRIPLPRTAAEDGPRWPEAAPAPAPGPAPSAAPAPDPAPDPGTAPAAAPAPASPPPPEMAPTSDMAPRSHKVLKSLLGAWALAACSAEETAAVEAHLTDCATCADEAVRLREAVALLHPEDNLDLDPRLRSRVLASCLGRRPARVPVPAWAAPYDAETARLDALLHDIGEAEWQAPVRLRWFDGERPTGRDTTVAAVIGHLTAVDGLVARALGLPDPLGAATGTPTERTEALWAARSSTPPGAMRAEWREQGRTLIRGASFADQEAAGLAVPYGPSTLPVRDAFLDRAFECWIHAEDIADAVDYPYHPPSPGHLHELVGLAARMLPAAIAARRRAGLAPPAHALAVAGAPGRSLHLEVEGSGGGHWHVALDSPAATPSSATEVAHVALDAMEFCRLAAGHVHPEDAAAGQSGDREAILDALYATASLSRM
ncbi:maleylpyruvate isomerase N-terminal domain-containing protein [Streptomyces nondiastaticus]|uniref:maleylpyruvate isomerase N-terminal domain-containing protein n=1 Tax=Streptomyces nondiastaticus TaxID=3154512 RepID=UPI003F4DF2D8